ncbi:hypothetical protein Pcinc_040254 [Petrolisthes cinctipes]|uniref:Uncharacterized protein n=1 Tax=Petrolisthes cinctipes TaxID=88211 RepID=A0AAE1BLW5_PETCI|nr:hypothetical protein Pcinc_040254 [Petrolisthes cinctipes]
MSLEGAERLPTTALTSTDDRLQTASRLPVVSRSSFEQHSIPVDEDEINLAKNGGVSFKKLTFLDDDDGLRV